MEFQALAQLGRRYKYLLSIIDNNIAKNIFLYVKNPQNNTINR
jgi:hypothetical protein